MALEPLSLKPLSLSRPKRRQQAAPKLSEAEAASLIERLSGALGSGVQYVGETLDKPGRAVRGIAVGKSHELANLIPFSDTMGLTNPRSSVSGRDVLEHHGILGRNTPGLDLGDVAGFGAELALDPTTSVVGPGKALAKGLSLGKALNVAGKAKHLGVSPARIIEELANHQRGLIGLKIPFAKEPFAVFGKGPTAAKIAEHAYYNPLTRGIRQAFDHRIRGQGAETMAAEKMLHQGLDKAYASQFDELANYQATMEGVAKRLPEVEELWNDIHKAFPSAGMGNFEESMRNAAEAKGLTYMQDLVAKSGAQPGSDLFSKAVQFDALAGHLTGLQNSAYKAIRDLGVNGKELDDLIAHTARQRNPALGSSNLGRGRTGTGFPYATRRKEPLRRLSTTTINQITTDPRVTGTKLTGKAHLDAAEAILHSEYGVPLSVAVKGKNGKIRQFKQARALARRIAKLPHDVIDSGGLFPRSTALDAMDYLKHATVIRGALSSVHDMAHKFADPKAIGPSVTDLFKSLGLTDKGAANWHQAFVSKTGKNIPLGSLNVPYDLAEAAGKMLKYHREPEHVTNLIRWFDKATGIFKGSLTVPFPAFHSRNFVSGLWQNMVTAFRTPTLARKAFGQVFDAMNGKNPDLLNRLKIYGILPDSMKAMQDILNSTDSMTAKVPSFGAVFNPLTSARRTAENASGLFSKKGFRGAAKRLAGGAGTWGRDANQLVEFLNRATHFAARLEDGWEPAMAARSTKLAHFDYAELSPFEKKFMRRAIPFYCVPENSEALTRDGWKSHRELEFGEELLTYNVEKDCYEWQPCLEVATFRHDEELLVWENKRHKLEFTEEHRWPVVTQKSTVKHSYGTYDYAPKRTVVEGKDLNTSHSFVVASEWWGEESILTPEQARLLGWLVTDGYWRTRGNHTEAMIYQSPKKYSSEVSLIAGGNPRKPHPDTGVICFPVLKDRVKEIKQYLDKDGLTKVVTRLSREAAEAMYDAMYKADGCTKPHRTQDFMAAQHPGVRGAFRILAFLLGKRCSESNRGCYVSPRKTMKVAQGKFRREHYDGIVWCPRTENGTWVMRQNGLVTITGNTFSRKNLPLQIRELFNNPGGPTAQTIRAMVDARKATTGDRPENQFTPKWLGEGLAFRLQGGNDRDAKFFSESGLLPVSEAFNRYPTMNGLPDVKMIAENVLGMTNPVLGGPLQYTFNRQFWSHRDLDQLNQTPLDNPTANFLLYQLPTSRAMATGRMLADERKTAKEKAFNALLGGARFTDVDLKKAINFQLREIIERELKGSAGVGEYQKLYARDLEKISPESKAQLALLVRLLHEHKEMQAEDVASGRAKPKKKAAQ